MVMRRACPLTANAIHLHTHSQIIHMRITAKPMIAVKLSIALTSDPFFFFCKDGREDYRKHITGIKGG